MADANVLIHVPYEIHSSEDPHKILPLQAGCLFILPSGNDIPADPDPSGSENNKLEHDIRKYRIFRVLRISNIAVYPASVTCELGPIYYNRMPVNEVEDFSHSNFNVLGDESDEYGY